VDYTSSNRSQNLFMWVHHLKSALLMA